MKLVGQYLVAQLLLTIAAAPGIASAQTTIAHRGLYHDANGRNEIPENTSVAVGRAYSRGMDGVELDLRLAADGVIMVTHDYISNRTTTSDNDGGGLNPVNVAQGTQGNVNPLYISNTSSANYANYDLKAYGTNATLTGTGYHMENLSGLLTNIRNQGMFGGSFKIILDIQDPTIFEHAASIVSGLGVQNNVYLKFFAVRGVFNNVPYNGADTCYNYMVQHNLADSKLKIIPQINDGELDSNEDDDAGISIWGTKLTIPTYLNCWSDAHAQHPSNTASMPIVSASVPVDNPKATAGATAALDWAASNGRQTMSVVPNPDAGRLNSHATACSLYSWQAASVPATSFDESRRAAKAAFVADYHPTYAIVDVMGDIEHGKYTTNATDFNNAMCYGTPLP